MCAPVLFYVCNKIINTYCVNHICKIERKIYFRNKNNSPQRLSMSRLRIME